LEGQYIYRLSRCLPVDGVGTPGERIYGPGEKCKGKFMGVYGSRGLRNGPSEVSETPNDGSGRGLKVP
jgi:hypothetical protein